MFANMESIKEKKKLKPVLELTTDIWTYSFWSSPILLYILKELLFLTDTWSLEVSHDNVRNSTPRGM